MRSEPAYGSCPGAVAGVILVRLLPSILSLVQLPEAGRQVIHGIVIIAMARDYDRSASVCG